VTSITVRSIYSCVPKEVHGIADHAGHSVSSKGLGVSRSVRSVRSRPRSARWRLGRRRVHVHVLKEDLGVGHFVSSEERDERGVSRSARSVGCRPRSARWRLGRRRVHVLEEGLGVHGVHGVHGVADHVGCRCFPRCERGLGVLVCLGKHDELAKSNGLRVVDMFGTHEHLLTLSPWNLLEHTCNHDSSKFI
jgi:hypothetical protein